VIVPTITGGDLLQECLNSLADQTFRDFEIVVVDNSGRNTVQDAGAKVIRNVSNVGFGAAINQGWRQSEARFIATLNDDAVAHTNWLEALVRGMEAEPEIGMCASQVRLYGSNDLDSAGMLIASDGSSKQRGHRQPASRFGRRVATLLPSASAALYRREMLDEIGGFEESFFLYCEDTDLGLRARWAGWQCVYVPDAIVEHRYSHSAGRASALKAYYVERNRLWTVIRTFPAGALARVPLASIVRYVWHVVYLVTGRGTTAEYSQGASAFELAWFVLKAHASLFANLPRLWRQRRTMFRQARISKRQFLRILKSNSISLRQVAAL
jgi:GT2 family glycosyltransferase